jgi:hypothetical protein
MARRSATFHLAAFVPVLFFSGCLAASLKNDGMTFRQALLDVYTDQAMDNLVRARTNQPFVQLAYRNILLQESNTYFGELSNAHTLTGTRMLHVPKPVTGALTRTLENVFTIHGSAQRVGLISYYADPVTDQNDIYAAYLEFANNPFLFGVSDTKPRYPVHVMRRSCGKYFFVPVEAAAEFQKLVLATTFLRGREATPPPPGYVEAKVVDATNRGGVGRGSLINVTLKLDKQVPNGNATMTFVFQGCRNARLLLLPQEKPDKDHSTDLGRPTDMFDTQWDLNSPATNFKPMDLIGKTVRIYSHTFPPEMPPPSQGATQEVRDVLDRIRAFQNTAPVVPLGR